MSERVEATDDLLKLRDFITKPISEVYSQLGINPEVRWSDVQQILRGLSKKFNEILLSDSPNVESLLIIIFSYIIALLPFSKKSTLSEVPDLNLYLAEVSAHTVASFIMQFKAATFSLIFALESDSSANLAISRIQEGDVLKNMILACEILLENPNDSRKARAIIYFLYALKNDFKSFSLLKYFSGLEIQNEHARLLDDIFSRYNFDELQRMDIFYKATYEYNPATGTSKAASTRKKELEVLIEELFNGFRVATPIIFLQSPIAKEGVGDGQTNDFFSNMVTSYASSLIAIVEQMKKDSTKPDFLETITRVLSDRGVSIGVDNFGIGLSALHQLLQGS